ncbi:MAG TPA: hypothetical protein VL945_02280 [Candidatus Saccharimonadales bacterium]|nr:hypothetical protein [Candidatus Saccharimonadales bacterium]
MAISKSLIVGIVIAIVVILIIASLYLYISIQTSALIKQFSNQTVAPSGPLYGVAKIDGVGILSYNNSRYAVESAILNYSYPNATSGNVILSMYSSSPVERIYLINTSYSCFKCIDEDLINQSLVRYLGQYGLIFNSSSYSYVNLTAVPDLPRNSIIIVPSGLMPSVLLPFSGQNPNQARTDILNLMNRGDTIIYVGYNFSRSIENGINYISSNQTISYLINSGINSSERAKPAPSGSGFYFNSPTFGLFNGSTYGPVAYVRSGNGTLVAFSNYPSIGWPNASALSHDLALAVYSRPWLPVLAQSPLMRINSSNGTVPMFTISLPLYNTNAINSVVNRSYSLAELQVFNNSGGWIVKELPFRYRFENNGSLGLPAVIGEGQSIPISIYVGGKSPQLNNVTVGNFTKNSLLFHIEIFNSTGSYIYSLPVGFFNTSLSVVIYSMFAFKPGYYTASLRDIDNRIYENALFDLPPFQITPISINFKSGSFRFSVINNNQSVSGLTYLAKINGGYAQTGAITDGILNYTLKPGSVIPYGNQTITLSILNTTYSASSYYERPPGGSIPPLYIEFGVAALAIIVLNLIIKAPTRDEYFIDVPLFPPTDKVEVKTTAPEVLGIFSTINEKFGWRHMPLTAEEIKSGVSSNIRYNNMPIMITMENSTEILYRLADSDQVEIIQPYFMPKKWVEESHHDMEYLVIFRKLRDFAVKNAILFTDLDMASDADMIMTNRGAQSYLYIYSSRSGARELKVAPGAKVFLIFLDVETKAQFLDNLSNTYSDEAKRLRMAIAASTVVLIDGENLEQLLY